MKYLIASDLHGSAFFISKLVKRFEEEKMDKIILLGDILYHGPRNSLPSDYDTIESANLLNKYADKILCVRGNCDAEVDKLMLNFSIESKNMILTVDSLDFFITHGHYYNTSNLPPISSFDILLHGHTHVPCFQEIGERKYYINPGSVSIPKENSTNSYLIYENRKFLWKDLLGNIYKEEKI